MTTPADGWEALWSRWRDLAGAPGEARFDALRRLARDYQAFGEALLRLSAGGGDLARDLATVLERLADGDATDADGLTAFFTALPGELASLQAMLCGGPADAWQQRLLAWSDEFLALPAVGPQRDWQAALQRLGRAVVAERAAATTLTARHRAANALALKRFAAWLRDEAGQPVTSLAGLFDAWVDVAETAYGETVLQADYAREFGAWVNAASAVRAGLTTLRDRFAGLLDLPQRAEINALLARQRELETTVAALREEMVRLADRPSAPPVVAAAASSASTAKAASSPAPTPAVDEAGRQAPPARPPRPRTPDRKSVV